jgi:hypothetical protein
MQPGGLKTCCRAAVDTAEDCSFTGICSPSSIVVFLQGVIYTLATMFVIYSCWGDERRQWAYQSRLSLLMTFNFLMNALWTFAFTQQWANLWLSTVIIFLGILLPLVLAYIVLRGPTSSPATLGRYICNHAFISLYLGWTSVACIANVALAGTPVGGWPLSDLYGPSTNYAWGWTPSNWSIVMQCVAALLAIAGFLFRHRDWIASSAVAWALFAIARQQSDVNWPGNSNVVTAARTLGALVLAGLLITLAFNVFTLWKGHNDAQAFAPSSWKVLGRPIKVRALGLVDEDATLLSETTAASLPAGDSGAPAGYANATLNPAHGIR